MLSSSSEGLFIWARLTRLARFPRSRLTSKSFVKFSMCSYERASWLGYRDFCFSNRDLGKGAGKFCHMNTSSRLPGWIIRNSACVKWSMTKQRTFITQQGCPNGIVLLCQMNFPYHYQPGTLTNFGLKQSLIIYVGFLRHELRRHYISCSVWTIWHPFWAALTKRLFTRPKKRQLFRFLN